MTAEERPNTDIDLAAESAALDEARSRRLALGDAADLIEDLIARPGSDPQWTVRVADALQGMRQAFDSHVTEVEHDEGLLPQLRHDSARLSNAIDRMYAEHITIGAELDDAAELIRNCGGDCGTTMVEAIREAVVDVLRSVSRHRQRGADLVYEAYHVDIGGG
jgi:iron-sulfur cluster repair protein YtfE (RIC family)